MFNSHIQGESWIVGCHQSACSQGRLHQASSARTCAACSAGCSAGARSWSAGSEASDSTARSALHNAGVHSAKASTGFGAEKIGIGDRQVVARDCQVEIVFKREIDRVFQGEVEFTVANHLIDARRVREHRLTDLVGSIWAERAMRSWHLEVGGSADLRMRESSDDNNSCQPNYIISERS